MRVVTAAAVDNAGILGAALAAQSMLAGSNKSSQVASLASSRYVESRSLLSHSDDLPCIGRPSDMETDVTDVDHVDSDTYSHHPSYTQSSHCMDSPEPDLEERVSEDAAISSSSSFSAAFRAASAEAMGGRECDQERAAAPSEKEMPSKSHPKIPVVPSLSLALTPLQSPAVDGQKRATNSASYSSLPSASTVADEDSPARVAAVSSNHSFDSGVGGGGGGGGATQSDGDNETLMAGIVKGTREESESGTTAVVRVLLKVYSGYFVISSTAIVILALVYNSSEDARRLINATVLYSSENDHHPYHHHYSLGSEAFISHCDAAATAGNCDAAAATTRSEFVSGTVGARVGQWAADTTVNEWLSVICILSAIHAVVLLGAAATILVLLK